MALVTYTGRSVKPKNELLKWTLGSPLKAWCGLDAFYLPKPSNLDYNAIRDYQIFPRNRLFYVEFVYKYQSVKTDIDTSRALGIDPGLNNWLTCVSNLGTSLIVDGLRLKSLSWLGITNQCPRLKKIHLKVFGLSDWLELQKNKTDRLEMRSTKQLG